MRLSHKIFIPISILVFSLIFILGASYAFLRQQKSIIDRKLVESEYLSALVGELGIIQRDIEFGILSSRFNRGHMSEVELKALENQIAAIITDIHELNTSDTGRKLINRFTDSRKGLDMISSDLLKAIEQGDRDEIQRHFSRWTSKVRTVDAALEDLVAFNLATLNRSAADFQVFVNGFRIVLVTLSLSGIVFTVMLSVYFRQSITKPISRLASAADDISSKNFDISLDLRSNDEIGKLARVFEDMSHKVRDYYENLEGEIRKKDEFIGIASHELKTPLTSLKIFIQMLERMALERGHSEYAPHLRKIDDQANKLTGLVSNLLDIARIEGGKIMYTKEEFDLNRLVRTVAEEARTLSTHQIDIEGGVARRAYGDTERISQIITNLVSNAVKYSPGGKKIIIRLEEAGSKAIVSVQDFGIGISKEHQTKIFERFYRAESKRQATFPGMGVGLYISAQIVNQHGGRIWVESEEGKGSIFKFTLPLA